MKTAKQIKKEARERFDKRFGKEYIISICEDSLEAIKQFLDQTIDQTIKQRNEELKYWVDDMNKLLPAPLFYLELEEEGIRIKWLKLKKELLKKGNNKKYASQRTKQTSKGD